MRAHKREAVLNPKPGTDLNPKPGMVLDLKPDTVLNPKPTAGHGMPWCSTLPEEGVKLGMPCLSIGGCAIAPKLMPCC